MSAKSILTQIRNRFIPVSKFNELEANIKQLLHLSELDRVVTAEGSLDVFKTEIELTINENDTANMIATLNQASELNLAWVTNTIKGRQSEWKYWSYYRYN